jgi:hypothetical protein
VSDQFDDDGVTPLYGDFRDNFGWPRIIGTIVGVLTFFVMLVIPSIIVSFFIAIPPEWVTDAILLVAAVSSIVTGTVVWNHYCRKWKD